MKYIEKQREPQELINWKNQANSDWKPTYDKLDSFVKQAIKQSLMAEQGYICCYCENALSDNDSHIEHFQPQSDPYVDSLDFSNLLCSCQNDLKKGEPRHCGTLKDNWFDETQLISPLDSTCEKRFAFTADGSIKPANNDDQGAVTTIEKLGLNIPKLRELRQKAIETFIDPDLTEDLSDEEIGEFVKEYLEPDDLGHFSSFWTTIRYLFGEYLNSINYISDF